MNVHQLEAALRDASPTTKERIRGTLADYSGVLQARIASLKDYAMKEQVLRRQCGFPVVAGADIAASRRRGLETRTTARTVPLVKSPAVSKKVTNSPVIKPTLPTDVFKESTLHGSRQPARSAEAESNVEGTGLHLPPPVSSSPAQLPATFMDHLEVSTASDRREEEDKGSSIAQPQPVFCHAEDEVKRLFARLRMESSIRGGSLDSNSLVHDDSESEVLSTKRLKDRYDELSSTNAALKRDVEEVLKRTNQTSYEEEIYTASTSRSFFFCKDCSEVLLATVERSLADVFNASEESLAATLSTTTQDDVDTRHLREELRLAQRENILVRMRRVELLARRLHAQRLRTLTRAMHASLHGFSLKQSRPSTNASTQKIDDHCVVIDALEMLSKVAAAHGALRGRETVASRAKEHLKGSAELIPAMSMLSELLWCVEGGTSK